MTELPMQKRRELQAAAGVSDKTVLRWMRGQPMKPSIKERVDAAAKKLRIRNENRVQKGGQK